MLLHQRPAEGERCLLIGGREEGKHKLLKILQNAEISVELGATYGFQFVVVMKTKRVTISINVTCPHVQFKLWLQG